MMRAARVLALCQEVLFPRRCPFCDEVLGFSGPCAACAEGLRPTQRVPGAPVPLLGREARYVDCVYAPYFYEGIARNAILRMKFYDRPELAAPLAADVAEALRAADALPPFDLLVSVPAVEAERRGRGYDVPKRLAHALGGALELPVARALRKTRETPRQAQLSGKARRSNLRGAFAARPEVPLSGKRVLLVDDVYTTGATLDECAKELKAAGAVLCAGACVAAVR